MRQRKFSFAFSWRGRKRLTRLERLTQARRERARAHLARVRSGPRPATPRARRGRVPLVLLLSLAAGLVFGRPLLEAVTPWLAGERSLDAIHVRGAVELALDEIAAATGLARGAPSASVDAGAVVAQLESHPWILEARAVRLPTGQLLVDIDERSAVAVVRAGSPPQPFVVDAAGTPFARASGRESAGLPQLVSADAVAPGAESPQLAEAVRIARRLPELGLPAPAEVRIAGERDPEGFALQLPELAARIVLGWEDLDARLERLVRLLEEPLPELEKMASVDLRFADQVVLRKAPTSSGSAQAAAVRGGALPSKTRPSG